MSQSLPEKVNIANEAQMKRNKDVSAVAQSNKKMCQYATPVLWHEVTLDLDKEDENEPSRLVLEAMLGNLQRYTRRLTLMRKSTNGAKDFLFSRILDSIADAPMQWLLLGGVALGRREFHEFTNALNGTAKRPSACASSLEIIELPHADRPSKYLHTVHADLRTCIRTKPSKSKPQGRLITMRANGHFGRGTPLWLVHHLLKAYGHGESQSQCNALIIGTFKAKHAVPENRNYQSFENALCAVSIPPATPESPTTPFMMTDLRITNVWMKLVETLHELHRSDFYQLGNLHLPSLKRLEIKECAMSEDFLGLLTDAGTCRLESLTYIDTNGVLEDDLAVIIIAMDEFLTSFTSLTSLTFSVWAIRTSQGSAISLPIALWSRN
jgi:hypothetical protein